MAVSYLPSQLLTYSVTREPIELSEDSSKYQFQTYFRSRSFPSIKACLAQEAGLKVPGGLKRGGSSPMEALLPLTNDHRSSVLGEKLDQILFLRENALMANFELGWL